jgi:Fur family ferric uptake transcriptional regulator
MTVTGDAGTLWRDDIAQALRQAGYRLTQPRLAVLRVLQEADAYLSPLEIHERAKRVYRHLGLVTVYRTLEVLDELGIVRRVHTRGQCHGYARAKDDRHYLVCRHCDHIIEFPCDGLGALIDHVQRRTGYHIEAHLLELTGLCPNCQAER